MSHETRILMNHIRRLQAQNRELAEVIAEERVWRKAAWVVYWERTNSKFMSIIRTVFDLHAGYDKAKRSFDRETARYAKAG